MISNKKIQTSLKLVKPFRLRYLGRIRSLLSKLKISNIYFTTFYPKKDIDLVLDASGFQFGDQWEYGPNYYKKLEKYYKFLKKNNTRIVFLPQAFGSFEKKSSKEAIRILNNYADLVIAREEISMNYLINAGVKYEKVLLYPDFTIGTKGSFPAKFHALRGGVCIIPNNKMLTHTHYTKDEYLEFYDVVINELNSKSKVFLLNHEGVNDLKLCEVIKNRFEFDVPIINGLNAKDVKGIIKESQLVISSRFHGVASALNQAVPCLSTSWSHKYELLLKYFGFESFVLDLNLNSEEIIQKVNYMIIPENQKEMRTQLERKSDIMKKEIEEMWLKVWSILENEISN